MFLSDEDRVLLDLIIRVAKKRLGSACILVAKSYKKERSPAFSLHNTPRAQSTDRASTYGSPRAYAVVGEIWYPSPTNPRPPSICLTCVASFQDYV